MESREVRKSWALGGFIITACLLLLLASPSAAEESRALDDPPAATPAQAPTPETPAPGDAVPSAWTSLSLDGALDSTAQTPPAPAANGTPVAMPAAPQAQGEEESGQPHATPEPSATPVSNGRTYTVRRGDTLFDIATSFGIPLDALIAANPLPNAHRLEVGQVITIPDGNLATQGASEPIAAPVVAGVEAVAGGAQETYTVQAGDTLFKIAQRLGLDMKVLVGINQLPDPNRIEVGQVLKLQGDTFPPASPTMQPTPPPSTSPPQPTLPAPAPDPSQPGAGQSYVVQRGDTVDKIAWRFGTTVSALATLNQLTDPNRIMPGQQLVVAGESNEATNASVSTPTISATPAPASTSAGGSEKVSSSGALTFVWPVPKDEGWLAKRFQYGHQAIDTILPQGTTIVASAPGVVEFSGWNEGGYGHLTVIDHGNGYRTLYAHQSERQVATGDQVAQGQIIGLVGSTGWSTHPHLHFEVIVHSQRVDPCPYLPTGCN